MTWGRSNQDRLKGVQQVQASGSAFAALLADGLVATWGNPDSSCDSMRRMSFQHNTWIGLVIITSNSSDFLQKLFI